MGEKFLMDINDIIDNRYQIVSFIGVGGTSLVYKSYDLVRKRDAAIKIMLDDISKNDEHLQRFESEASFLASLHHINIVQIYGLGKDNNKPYIAYELIKSPSLNELLLKNGAFSYKETYQIMMQILDGIEYIHKFSLIHCDIKPHNIFYGIDGVIKIGDFGIAMFEKTSLENKKIQGSIPYLAPEVIQGKSPSFQSDIYALGITFYELLTNRLPFDGVTNEEIIYKHLKSPFPSLLKYCPSLNKDVESVIYKACSKNPLDRFKTVEEFKNALKNIKNPYKKKKISIWKRLFKKRSNE